MLGNLLGSKRQACALRQCAQPSKLTGCQAIQDNCNENSRASEDGDGESDTNGNGDKDDSDEFVEDAEGEEDRSLTSEESEDSEEEWGPVEEDGDEEHPENDHLCMQVLVSIKLGSPR